MKRIRITINVPFWVLHLAWVAAVATAATVILVKSGADIGFTISGRR
ncbi:hypothetical protein AB0H88_37610 [Nonomuraea sp. NPDC050680]